MTPSTYGSLVVDSVRRASRCSARIEHVRLNRGLGTLGAISQTAPFVGLIGTCFGIMNSFRGTVDTRLTGIYYVSEFLGEALVPACLGIAVSLLAIAIRRCLMNQMELFDLEMESVSVGLLNILAPHVAELSRHHFANLA